MEDMLYTVSEVAKILKCNVNKPMSSTRLYRIWNGMLQRCFNSNRPTYDRYGGRGITVCDEWKFFGEFQKWALSNGYADNLTLDRINNDENYEPSNCRWATYKEQANNRRSNIMIEIDGELHNLKEWCEIYDISYTTVYTRIKYRHWDVISALTVPIERMGSKHGRYVVHC